LTELKANESLSDINDVMKLQANAKCCDHFLSCIMEKVEWKRQVVTKQVKDFDEAFALLVLKNIWDEWIMLHMNSFFKTEEKYK